MEELGRINIDINEGGAAGAGAGAVADEPTVKRVRSAAQKLAEALERLAKVQQIQYNKQFGDLTQKYDVAQGFLSFARRPSFGGAMELIRPGTETGNAISKLGKSASLVSNGLLAFGVAASVAKFVFGTLVKTFEFFEGQMRRALDRIRELTALSGQLSMIEAIRQTQNLQMKFAELNANMAEYLKLATINLTYEREKARLNIELNRISADLGRTFQLMMTGVFSIATDLVKKLVPRDLGPLLEFAVGWTGATEPLSGILSWLIEIGRTTNQIQQNTRPKIDFTKANEWALQDIQAMTGRKY